MWEVDVLPFRDHATAVILNSVSPIDTHEPDGPDLPGNLIIDRVLAANTIGYLLKSRVRT